MPSSAKNSDMHNASTNHQQTTAQSADTKKLTPGKRALRNKETASNKYEYSSLKPQIPVKAITKQPKKQPLFMCLVIKLIDH